MLDPIFSNADLFMRDPGPRRHQTGGQTRPGRQRPGLSYPERDMDYRRR